MPKDASEPFRCRFCLKTYSTRSNRIRHEQSVHGNRELTCELCDTRFARYDNLQRHEKTCGKGPYHRRCDQSSTSEQYGGARDITTALNGAAEDRLFYPRDSSSRNDLLHFLAQSQQPITAYLKSKLRRHAIKWYVVAQVEFYKEDKDGGITTATPYFRSVTYTDLTDDTFSDTHVHEAFQKVYAGMENYIRESSGWNLRNVRYLKVHIAHYAPLSGSTFINLPRTLKQNRSVLNIKNTQDTKCFLWSILAHVHPSSRENDSVETYCQYEQEMNMHGIEYPVSLPEINKFESQNGNISVNVFGFEDKDIVPLRITKRKNRATHVNLLLLHQRSKTHYCLITNLNAFLYRTRTHHDAYYFCQYCLHSFTKEDLLSQHIPYCSTNDFQRIVLPTKNVNSTLKFDDFHKQLPVPFIIYCDTETINRKIDTCIPNPAISHTTPTRHLDIHSFGYKVVSADPRYTKPSVIYRGADASDKFIQCLLKEKQEIEEILEHIEPMIITMAEEAEFQRATRCGICNEPFIEPGDKVQDHDHLTGKYRCAAHVACNLNFRQSKFIPVVFHGLRNFDSHIICQSIGKYEKEGPIKCIPQNFEKYISFSLGSLRFIDSCQFLPSSLEILVDNLKCNEGRHKFKHFHSEFEDDCIANLLLRKNVFPYDYLTDESKFEENVLPPKHEFYNDIRKQDISDEDYDHACRVFRELNVNSLGDYSDLYLKTDVLLLTDVFENFREICLRDYSLDPAHFYSAPGLSFSAMLRMTKVELDLLTDVDQLRMFELGLRGGISQISHRHSVANNYYMKEYDPSKPVSYISYLDANNLYGWAMMQKLPMRDFRFLDEEEIRTFDVNDVDVEADTGYLVECSLHYDISLHDSHQCLPLAPEKRKIVDDELSEFAKQLWRDLNGEKCKRPGVEKLVTTLHDKDHYVLHSRNLKLYVSLGLEIKQIHRVLAFHQEEWLRSYIEFNTSKRANAKTKFESFFYKTLNCSVFGKLMENQRKHRNIKLVSSEKRINRLVAKPTFRSSKLFNESLVGVELKRVKVCITKPIYAGQAVLDISKCLMYDFWYNHLKAKYAEKVTLLMSDTDSLLFHVETNNIFVDMHDSAHLFDTSNFPKTNFFHSNINNKIPGRFKSETDAKIITRFTGLRSKMYAFTLEEKDAETKRAKGISRAVVEKELHYKMYEETLMDNNEVRSEMDMIRSRLHELYVLKVLKKSLSSFDDKRFLVSAVDSIPYGHYTCDLYF